MYGRKHHDDDKQKCEDDDDTLLNAGYEGFHVVSVPIMPFGAAMIFAPPSDFKSKWIGMQDERKVYRLRALMSS